MERELPLDSGARGGVMYLLAAERDRGGRARAERPRARTLRTGYCERKIELKSSSDDSDGSDKLGPAS